MKSKPFLLKLFAALLVFAAYSFDIFSQETQQTAEQPQEVSAEQKKAADAPLVEPKPESEYYPRKVLEDKYLSFGVKIGGTASPGMFTGVINVDFLLDELFSLGPYFQGSFGGDIYYMMALLDGKFRISGFNDNMKFTVLTGAGYIYRSINAISFHHFAAHIGAGGEYFINDYISLGIELTSNHTSSPWEKFFFTFLGGANFYL